MSVWQVTLLPMSDIKLQLIILIVRQEIRPSLAEAVTQTAIHEN